jgi:hypothetical protein
VRAHRAPPHGTHRIRHSAKGGTSVIDWHRIMAGARNCHFGTTAVSRHRLVAGTRDFVVGPQWWHLTVRRPLVLRGAYPTGHHLMSHTGWGITQNGVRGNNRRHAGHAMIIENSIDLPNTPGAQKKPRWTEGSMPGWRCCQDMRPGERMTRRPHSESDSCQNAPIKMIAEKPNGGPCGSAVSKTQHSG